MASSSSKQKVHGLKIYGKKHKAIKNLKKKGYFPEIHGDKVWFSSYFIMDYLLQNPLPKKSRVLEIGCGWGLLSIFCTKQFKAKAVGVDADKNVFPMLKLHARKNRVKVKTKTSRYEDLKPKFLAKHDMIYGGDICFWDELVDPLFKVIKNAMKNNVRTIVIADPGRSPFLTLAKRCKKRFNAKLIHTAIDYPSEHSGYLLIIHNKKGK